MASDQDYRDIPSLAAYIDRIGAVQVNFRKFIVKGWLNGYPREEFFAMIMKDGELKCKGAREYIPTKEEAEKIKEELKNVKFPSSIPASRAQVKQLKPMAGSIIYEFLNDAGDISFVQERTEINGKKVYLPWTFWDDGQWRRMEPDSKLPLWRPSQKPTSASVMIHEGAKAALAVNAMLEDKERRKRHPWSDFLNGFEHWGIIGGALSPHRTDFGPLRRRKPDLVVYACDNDFIGRDALQHVSREYGYQMKGLLFDSRFPHGWDMADELPESFFSKDGRYIGQDPQSLMTHATYATELDFSLASKRPPHKIKPHFAEEWHHVVEIDAYIHRDWPSMIYNAGQFNNAIMPFSDVKDTAKMLQKFRASKAAVIRYEPALCSGVYNDELGRQCVNCHVPGVVRKEAGDIRPFLDYLEHFIPPEGDRRELMRWLATLIALPSVKMRYGVLLISEQQGVGKSTLGEKILRPIMGDENVSFPNESEIVDSNFHYWMARKRLAFVPEIYAGHNAKAYNKVKSVITDDILRINTKNFPVYTLTNKLHVIACSNSKRALKLDDNDRRWLVPKVTECQDQGLFLRFNKWIEEENGCGKIVWWASEFLKKNAPVMTGDFAPWTSAKREVIEANYGPAELIVKGVLQKYDDISLGHVLMDIGRKLRDQKMIGPNGEVMIRDVGVIRIVERISRNNRGSSIDGMIARKSLRKIAKNENWIPSDDQRRVIDWGGNEQFKLIFNRAAGRLSSKTIEEIREELRPIDLSEFNDAIFDEF